MTIDCSRVPLLNALLASRQDLRYLSLKYQFPSIPRNQFPYIFTLYTPRSLDLIVFWTIPSQNRQGHHLLADLKFGPGENSVAAALKLAETRTSGMYEETQKERAKLINNLSRSEYAADDSPIFISCESTTVVDLNFGQNS